MGLITIHKLFKNISDSHISINGFEMGKSPELGSDKDELYPMLFVSDNITNTVFNDTMMQQVYNFSIFVVDRAEKMQTPQEENTQYHYIKILAKCERIALDIIEVLMETNVVQLKAQPIITIFALESENEIYGVEVNLSITLPQSVSFCDMATIFPNLDLDVLC